MINLDGMLPEGFGWKVHSPSPFETEVLSVIDRSRDRCVDMKLGQTEYEMDHDEFKARLVKPALDALILARRYR